VEEKAISNARFRAPHPRASRDSEFPPRSGRALPSGRLAHENLDGEASSHVECHRGIVQDANLDPSEAMRDIGYRPIACAKASTWFPDRVEPSGDRSFTTTKEFKMMKYGVKGVSSFSPALCFGGLFRVTGARQGYGKTR